MDGQWPLALREDVFRPEREGLRKAIAAALEEDKEGNLDPDTIQAVQTAIDKLRPNSIVSSRRTALTTSSPATRSRR